MDDGGDIVLVAKIGVGRDMRRHSTIDGHSAPGGDASTEVLTHDHGTYIWSDLSVLSKCQPSLVLTVGTRLLAALNTGGVLKLTYDTIGAFDFIPELEPMSV